MKWTAEEEQLVIRHYDGTVKSLDRVLSEINALHPHHIRKKCVLRHKLRQLQEAGKVTAHSPSSILTRKNHRYAYQD